MCMKKEPPLSISSHLDTDLPVWYTVGDEKGGICNVATCTAGFCGDLSTAANLVFISQQQLFSENTFLLFVCFVLCSFLFGFGLGFFGFFFLIGKQVEP